MNGRQSEMGFDLHKSVLGTDPGNLPGMVIELNIPGDTGEVHTDDTTDSSNVLGPDPGIKAN